MAVLDTLRDVIGSLTGANERRQAQQRAEQQKAAAQEADRQAKAQRLAEAEKARLTTPRTLVEDPRIRVQVERERGPAVRLQDRLQVQPQARQPEAPREEVATQMKYTPGLQQAPSVPGPGKVFVSGQRPRVATVRQEQAKPEVMPVRESFVERVTRVEGERRAAEAERMSKLTPQQREAETNAILKQLEQGKVRELERGMHRRGLELGD